MEEILVVIAAVAAIVFEMWSMKRTESALLMFKDEIRKQENHLHEFRYETLLNMKELERTLSILQAVQAMQSAEPNTIMFEPPSREESND